MRLLHLSLAASALTVPLAVMASPATAADHAATPCSGALSRAVIPVWARAGFSEPEPRVTHVLGHSGAIVAILFATPLQSPPAADHNNKILWVTRREPGFSALYVRAQRMRGTALVGRPVSRRVPGGPGPSTINLPASGCWRLTLTWKTGTDTLDLRYAAHA